jgi:mannose-1-phosphate guanylyltransferase/mannose-6-phosphate isomerase
MGMHQVVPFILCGGAGTRLWPLSRRVFHKQFLVLSGVASLFYQAVEYVNQIGAAEIAISNALVVTNEERVSLRWSNFARSRGSSHLVA